MTHDESPPTPPRVLWKATAWRAEIERIEVSHITEHYVYGKGRAGKFGRHKKISLDCRLFDEWDDARQWIRAQTQARIDHLRIQMKAAEYLARAAAALNYPGEE